MGVRWSFLHHRRHKTHVHPERTQSAMAEVIHTGKGRRILLDGAPINLGDSTATAEDDTIVDILSGSDGVFVRFRGEGTTHVTVGHGGQSVTVEFSAEAAPLEGVTFEDEIPLA